MPDIKIVKLKLRRGSELQRQLITLDQGELGYTTDTNRIFVGDGHTTGGLIINSNFFLPIPSNKTGLPAYPGDVVVENNLTYQLTGTNSAVTSAWKLISPIIDNATIQLNGSNAIRVANNGVNVAQLGNIVYSQGGIVKNTTQGLSANTDNTTIIINTSNQLAISTVYASSIIGKLNNSQINTTTIAGSALSGTSYGSLNVLADTQTIVISANRLCVGSINASQVTTGTFGAARIASTALGSGLQGGDGTQLSVNVDNSSITYAANGSVQVNSLFNASKIPLSSNNTQFQGFLTYTPASGVSTINIALSTVSSLQIAVGQAGSGYVTVPSVSVQPPHVGAGYFSASAIATILNGQVASLSVTNPGSGYNYAPSVVISPPAHNETTYQVTTATTTGGILSSARTFTLSSGGFVVLDFGAGLGIKAIPVFNVPTELQSLTLTTVTA